MRIFNTLMRVSIPSSFTKTKWATIVELMVVLAILWMGISGLLQTLSASINYARDTENNIKAINIAREGIEAMTNIRETNWLRFSSDKLNCWRVQDYSSSCIGNTTSAGKIASGSYSIYSQNGVWFLSGATSPGFTSWNAYKNIYQVGLDTNGFYTQTGISATPCSAWVQKSCTTIFTREINLIVSPTNSGSMNVQSITRWFDRRPQNVTLETTLTNWKSNF